MNDERLKFYLEEKRPRQVETEVSLNKKISARNCFFALISVFNVVYVFKTKGTI